MKEKIEVEIYFDKKNIVSYQFQRVVKTFLITMIPEEWISDFHLDSFCILFYNKKKEPVATKWIRPTKKILIPEDVVLPIETLVKFIDIEFILMKSAESQ